ncbi:hypothetical protein BV394_03755 [Brevirhabdus pacifica]|uniref:DUF4174 domain-containing protein n=1 Tax=Brevirhabdus pacifica TaxID=1267768 RepID=A0A1U7DGD4_9RHOB|nr:DUF4174 domain-containing protein [Brevirhabdus pacifica]APX88953.1 hypothetical protein BV394_03755 [Brevirhabdus pacifica]OWU80177.1 hypothetical protein ATO5_04440 [Loktanella sp. 22II-4b]PJJ86494.1 uncharacterized protein DUF4174 [Brevirhabdus pacifica]
MNQTLRVVFAALFGFAAMGVTAAEDSGKEEPPLTPAEMWEGDRSLEFDAVELNLDDFLWIARPVVIFAETPADPSLQQQLQLLADRKDELAERDVVVIVDTNPEAKSPLRQKLRPRGFMLVLIGKDGNVKLRKPFPWDVRELTRVIDKSPVRQQEVRDRRNLAQ